MARETSSEEESDSESEVSEISSASEDEKEWSGEYTTSCWCDMGHDDENMIECEKCSTWQHMVCMGLMPDGNNPKGYHCHSCRPRRQKLTKGQAQKKQREYLAEKEKQKELKEMSRKARLAKKHREMEAKERAKQRKRDVAQRARERKQAAAPTRKGSLTPKRGSITPKKGSTTPRKGSTTPKKGSTTPKKGSTTPKKGSNTPKKGSTTPKKKPVIKAAPKPRSPSPDTVEEPSNEETDSPPSSAKEETETYTLITSNDYSARAQKLFAGISDTHPEHLANMVMTQLQPPKYIIAVVNDETQEKGMLAVEALDPITIVAEYLSRVSLLEECPEREPVGGVVQIQPHCLMYNFRGAINRRFILDARQKGGDARFIRQSCKPNTVLKHCKLKGVVHFMLTAEKRIESGSEMTLPFDADYVHSASPLACTCANIANCPAERARQQKMKELGSKTPRSTTSSGYKSFEEGQCGSRGDYVAPEVKLVEKPLRSALKKPKPFNVDNSDRMGREEERHRDIPMGKQHSGADGERKRRGREASKSPPTRHSATPRTSVGKKPRPNTDLNSNNQPIYALGQRFAVDRLTKDRMHISTHRARPPPSPPRQTVPTTSSLSHSRNQWPPSSHGRIAHQPPPAVVNIKTEPEPSPPAAQPRKLSLEEYKQRKQTAAPTPPQIKQEPEARASWMPDFDDISHTTFTMAPIPDRMRVLNGDTSSSDSPSSSSQRPVGPARSKKISIDKDRESTARLRERMKEVMPTFLFN